jgi:hypothetical protein
MQILLPEEVPEVLLDIFFVRLFIAYRREDAVKLIRITI